VGGERTAKICERFAKGYKQARSGFPDLFLWDKQRLDVKAVEVKGPGDKLMDHQKTWIDFLLALPIAVEVCLVRAKKQ
jgi:Fanconi-associated nuclease 1